MFKIFNLFPNFKEAALVWNYLSVLSKIFSTFISLKIAIIFFSENGLSTWYLLISYFTIFSVFGVGFSPTFIRHLRRIYVLSQENNIIKFISFFYKILLYFFITSLFSIVFLKFYFFFLKSSAESIFFENILTINTFILSIFFSIFFITFDIFFISINEIRYLKKTLTFSNLIQVITFYFLVNLGFDVESYFISLIIAFLFHKLSLLIFMIKNENYIFSIKKFSILLKNIKVFKYSFLMGVKQFLAIISGYITLRLPILISPYFLISKEINQIGLTIQIISIIVIVSSVLVETKIPDIIKNFLNKKLDKVYSFSVELIFLNFTIYSFSIISILFFGSLITDFIFGKQLIQNSFALILLLFFYFLENNQSLFQTIYSAKNNVEFYKFNLIVLFAILLVFLMLSNKIKIDIVSIVLIPFLLNIPNNIIWPYKVFKFTRPKNAF